MRTIGQLYQVILDHFDTAWGWSYSGICQTITLCSRANYITSVECDALQLHFYKQRPTIFSRFWWSWPYKIFTHTRINFWWDNTKAGDKQRKLFLAYLAKKYADKHFEF